MLLSTSFLAFSQFYLISSIGYLWHSYASINDYLKSMKRGSSSRSFLQINLRIEFPSTSLIETVFDNASSWYPSACPLVLLPAFMQFPIQSIEPKIFLKFESPFILSNALIKQSYCPYISCIVFSNYSLKSQTFILESNFFFYDKVMKYSSVTSHLYCPSESS